MSQFYTDPSRESDPYALPNAEVWYEGSEGGDSLAPGWYWQTCFPGCLPDGEPTGPFDTKQEAIKDAQEWIG